MILTRAARTLKAEKRQRDDGHGDTGTSKAPVKKERKTATDNGDDGDTSNSAPNMLTRAARTLQAKKPQTDEGHGDTSNSAPNMLTRAARTLKAEKRQRDDGHGDTGYSEVVPVKKERNAATDDDVPLMDAVKACHAAIARHWSTSQIYPPIPMPPIRGSILCHRYYDQHTPANPKLILFGESHALTDPKACGMQIAASQDWKLPETVRKILEQSHCGHVSLVHCLSYGEKRLLRSFTDLPPSAKSAITTGTPTFFKMLFSFTSMAIAVDNYDPLANGNFAATFQDLLKPQGKKETDVTLSRRIQFKWRILQDLLKRGVALYDWSPVSSYLGNQNEFVLNKKTLKPYYTNVRKLNPEELRQIHRTCFGYYVCPVLQHYQPEKVLVLSKGIQKNVGEAIIRTKLQQYSVEYLGAKRHPSSTRANAEYCRELRDLANLHLAPITTN